MASHEEIGLSQPAASTTTHKLDAVVLDKNSTNVLREVLVVGSPETTNALAAVLAGVPASTEWGLAVRPVGYSTVVSVAALPANSSQVEVRAMPANSSVVAIGSITGPVSTAAPATSDTGLIVRQVGYSTIVSVAAMPAGSTTVSVAAMPANSSVVALGSVAAGLLSTAAAAVGSSALNVRIVGGVASAADFVSNVSSVAGVVSVSPNSTGWVKSAGLSVDSSNYLNVNASFTGSTDVSISKFPAAMVSSAAAAGNSSALIVRIVGGPSSAADAAVQVHGNTSSNSSQYLPVRLTNGTAFLTPATDYTHASTLTPSTVTGPTVLYRASDTAPAAVSTSDMWVVPWASKLGAAQIGMVTSSGVRMDDSTNAALRVNVVAGATAGPTSTAAPATSDTGLIVRQVGYSTTVQVSSVGGVVSVSPNSTGWANAAGFSVDSSNFLNVNASFTGSTQVEVRALPAGMISTAAPATGDTGLIVRQVGYSTIVTVAAMPANSSVVAVGSFAAGLISSAAPALGSSGLVVHPVGYSTIVSVAAMPANSSQVEVRAMPANSSVVALGSIAAGLLSSGAPAHGSSALIVRQAVSSLQSTTVTITSSNSTALYTLLSSNAGRQRVYGYFIGASTSGNHSTMLIGGDTNVSKWAVVLSSGVFGANLAVSPPGFLFEAPAGSALQVRIESASTAITARVALSYFID